MLDKQDKLAFARAFEEWLDDQSEQAPEVGAD
jgi:hypothetical protein